MTDNILGVTDLKGAIKLVNVQDRPLNELEMITREYSKNHTVVYLENYISSKSKHIACAGILHNVRKKNDQLCDIFRLIFMTVNNRVFIFHTLSNNILKFNLTILDKITMGDAIGGLRDYNEYKKENNISQEDNSAENEDV